MSDMERVSMSRDRAPRANLMGQPDVGGTGVRRSGRGREKIRNSREGGFVFELPEAGGLNRDIEITVRIPAYLVAGLMKEAKRGELDWCVREAVKEWLVKRGQTWWQPRFMAVLKAKEIEARNRFTRSGL